MNTANRPHRLKLQLSYAEYARSHKNRVNHRFHQVGITLIVYSVLGLLSKVRLWDHFSTPTGSWIPGFSLSETTLSLDGAILLLGFHVGWVALSDFVLALSYAPALLAVYLVSKETPLEYLYSTLILGFVLQGLGHKFCERNSPAFFKNLKHLFVGPVWYYARLIHRA